MQSFNCKTQEHKTNGSTTKSVINDVKEKTASTMSPPNLLCPVQHTFDPIVCVTSGCLPWKGGSMSNPETYSWQQAYLAAVLETDNDLMPLRIYEALAAIEQRLLSPMDAIEQRTVDDAQTGLLTLKAERIAEGKHVIHEGQLSKETC